MFLRARAPGTAPMAFSAVGLTKVKKEMDVGEEAERAVTAPSPNCSSGYNPIVYSLGTRDQRQNNYLQRHFPNQPTAQGSAAQSQHIFLNEATSRGVGRATHDFLSLYGGTPSHFVQPIPMTRGASSSLATQDLLQPLERGNSPKYQESEVLLLDKPTKEVTLSQHGGNSATPVVGGRLLPIFVSSQMNASMAIPQMQLLRLAEPEGNAQGIWCNPQMSLSTSHEEHLLVESMRSSDATVEQEHIENRKCWSNPRVNYALSDLLYVPKGSSNHGGSYQPVPVLSRHWQKGSHPFVEVIKRPFKVPSEDDEEDEVEGLDHTIDQSKESHFVKGEHASRDGKNIEARATTPRSKHSATEQRRRSKINDRFQTLRNLVPHSDQKRDKASFLLEVIEYVQVLQEKVRKYEGVEQGRHQERLNNVVWESSKKSVDPEAFSRDATTMDNAVFLKNITSTGLAVDVKPISETHDFIRPKLIIFSPSASENGAPPADFYPCVRQQSDSYINGRSAVISNGIDSSPENQNCKSVIPKPCSSSLSGQHDLRAIVPTPRSVPDSQMISCLPKRCGTTCNMDELAHLTEESMSAANLTEQSHTQWDAKYPVQLGVEPQGGRSGQFMEPMPAPEKSVTPVNSIQGPSGGTIASNQMHNTYPVNGVVATNKEEIRTYASKDNVLTPATHIRDDSFAVTGGIISVSSLYSQELLETLTRALQSSGLDLSRANISVQIDLGKRGEASTAFSSDKHTIGPIPESSSQSQKSKDHARTAGMRSESDVPWKKPKVQHV